MIQLSAAAECFSLVPASMRLSLPLYLCCLALMDYSPPDTRYALCLCLCFFSLTLLLLTLSHTSNFTTTHKFFYSPLQAVSASQDGPHDSNRRSEGRVSGFKRQPRGFKALYGGPGFTSQGLLTQHQQQEVG